MGMRAWESWGFSYYLGGIGYYHCIAWTSERVLLSNTWIFIDLLGPRCGPSMSAASVRDVN